MKQRICPECQQSFTPKIKNAVVCSPECRKQRNTRRERERKRKLRLLAKKETLFANVRSIKDPEHEKSVNAFIARAEAYADEAVPGGNKPQNRDQWNLVFHRKMDELTIQAGLRVPLQR